MTISVDGLTATGGIGQIALNWNPVVDDNANGGLPYLQAEAVEVWASQTDDFNTATMIGEQSGATSFTHSGLERGATWYYWLRPRYRGRLRDGSAVYGDVHPSGNGVIGMEANNQSQLGESGYFVNSNGLVEEWGRDISAETEDGDGFIVKTFQYPFTQIFGVWPVVDLTDNEDGVVTAFATLQALSTTGFTLRVSIGFNTILVEQFVPTNGLPVYWHAKGV